MEDEGRRKGGGRGKQGKRNGGGREKEGRRKGGGREEEGERNGENKEKRRNGSRGRGKIKGLREEEKNMRSS